MNISNKLIKYCLYRSYKFEDYHPLDEEFPILSDLPFVNKYIRLDINDITYIKLRFKDINNWEEYLSEILGRQIKLYPENLSQNKEYVDKYDNIKKNFVISQEMFDFFTNHRLFIKYNSEKEQEEYKTFWSQRIRSNEFFESLVENDEYLPEFPVDFNFINYGLYNNLNGEYTTLNQLKFHYLFYGKREGLTDKLNEFQIIYLEKCEYGCFDDGKNVVLDVTDIVKSLIVDSKLELFGRSYNDIFTDPIYGTFKTLRIYHDCTYKDLKENEGFKMVIHSNSDECIY